MATIKTLLLDDEQAALDSLEFLLGDFEQVTVVAKLTDPLEALRQLCVEEIDLLFVDIQMPGVDGISLVKKVREFNSQVVVVFVTAFQDHTNEAIKLNVFNYLLKPIDRVELRDTIDKITARLTQGRSNNTILVNSRNEMLVIKVDEIASLEASGSYTILNLTDGTNCMCTCHLGKMSNDLDMKDFIKVNRSVYVRKDLIIAIRKKDKECTYQLGNTVCLVPVSSVFLRRINEYF